MKLTYAQLKKDLDLPLLGGNPDMWFAYIWSVLEVNKMTNYDSAEEKISVYKNAFGMIKVYCDCFAKLFDIHSDVDGLYITMDLSEFGDFEKNDISEILDEELDYAKNISDFIIKEIGINRFFITLMCALKNGILYDDASDEVIEISSLSELLNPMTNTNDSIISNILNDSSVNSNVVYEWLTTTYGD